jgi:hypothetical protein
VRRLRLDRFETLTLLALLAMAYAVLAGLVLRTIVKGGVVTGGDGFLVADPLQYLTWLRQAGEHVGIGNLYDLAPGPRPFVHPLLLLAGWLHELGLGVAAAYHVLKVPAALVLFAGTLAWCRRFLDRAGLRVALVLALFAASPIAAVVGWSGLGGEEFKLDVDFVSGELWTFNWLWGYQFTALAVGLVPLGLLAYERDRLGWCAVCALLCTWIQPWQGATLLITIVAAELLTARRLTRLVLPCVAGALPAVYYWVLSREDDAWRLAGEVNAFPRWSLLVTVLGLLPLALPALPAFRRGWRASFGDSALRVWPLAGLLVFYLPVGTFPFHAFQGLFIPLAVLAVLGVPSLARVRVALTVVLLLVVPGTLYRGLELRDAVGKGFQPFFLTAEEREALRHLEARPEAGGVLAPVYSGLLIPAYTGRETYIGAGSWTPDFDRRLEQMEALFGGRMSAGEAERLVRRSGARFLFSDCHGRAEIGGIVATFTDPPARFGCATVWRVR